MTVEEMAKRSRSIVESFRGEDPGSTIQCLMVALGMAICFVAKSKEDAIDMVNCIMLDYETDLPSRWDEVQKSIAEVRGRQ